MIRPLFANWIMFCCIAASVAFAGCSGDTTTGSTGSLDLTLELAPGVTINEVDWEITGGDMEPMSGTIDTSAPGATASVEVFGLPPGDGYTITLTATDETGEVSCAGDAEFAVNVGVATDVMVFLNCKLPTRLGGVRANGKFNICAELAKVVVSPLQTSQGNNIDLSALGVDAEDDPVEYLWTATGGAIADASSPETTYTCAEVGDQLITISVSDDGFEYCMAEWSVPVSCVDGGGGSGGTGGAAGEGGAGGEGGVGGAAGEGGAGGAAGEGGAGGEGGVGGGPSGTAFVTAAHFAPEYPTAGDTAAAIFVNGEEVTALGTISYGQTTGRIMWPLPVPGTYTIGVGPPGGVPEAELVDVPLNDGDDIAAAAYRTPSGSGVALFAYNLSTEGLATGSGRVLVSHGADDPALNPVDIINTDDCPPPLLDDLAFGETRGPLDLPEGTYNLAFNLSNDCDPTVPFAAPVTPNVTSILVAVDEDTSAGLSPQVWALVDAETVVPLITGGGSEVLYSQDFESLDLTPSNALVDDGWNGVVVVFSPDGQAFLGAYERPPGTEQGAMAAIEEGQGGQDQGAKSLIIISDYLNGPDQMAGNRVEANTFQERVIEQSDVGKKFIFSFDGKRGNISGASTANAFIKLIFDPANVVVIDIDTTMIPDTWNRYSIELPVTADLVGVPAQFGFSSTASNFEPSQMVYDNVVIELADDSGGGGGEELTINGDFETGDFTGWMLFCADDPRCSITITDLDSNSGTFAANLVNEIPAPSPPAVIKQERIGAGQVSGGDAISISLAVRGEALDGAIVQVILITEPPADPSDTQVFILDPPSVTPAGWTDFTIDTNVTGNPTEGISVIVQAVTGGAPTSSANILVDDVSVTLP